MNLANFMNTNSDAIVFGFSVQPNFLKKCRENFCH